METGLVSGDIPSIEQVLLLLSKGFIEQLQALLTELLVAELILILESLILGKNSDMATVHA
ncbi:MAG: hypothetical protein KJN90_11230 [Gammaproteobacteria bacterium]|nr:hypothetical protein [Gammaproteobacteria bacterium]